MLSGFSFPRGISLQTGYRILLGFTFLMLTMFAVLDAAAPGGRRLAKITGIDTVNYFDVAHSLLFDHDFNLNNEFQRFPPDSRIWSSTQPSGLPGSPWGVGFSILEIPLIAAGTAIDGAAGRPADGYGPAAVYLYCLGPVLMTGLGMAALFHFLYHFALFRNPSLANPGRISLAATFAVFLGTNVGYYAFVHTSHAATFLCMSLLLALWWNVRDNCDTRRWLVLGLVGGLLSVCHWQDVLCLGGPGLYDLMGGQPWKNTRAWLRSRIAFIGGVVFCWIPQIVEWKVIYGKYVTIPQGGGFISFPPVYIPSVLFSSRNGWLTWTPLVALGLAGLLLGAVRSYRLFVPWLFVIGLEVSVIGAMQTWHGFDSFGSRYLIVNSSLIGMGLLTLVLSTGSRPRAALWTLATACCVFTCLFAIQFRLDLIPSNETLSSPEIFSDKLALVRLLRQKRMVRESAGLVNDGHPAEAVRLLESADEMGENRFVLNALRSATKATADSEKEKKAESRWEAFLRSRWN